jgi:hypothetical protein
VFPHYPDFVFVADALGGWLIGQLADAGRKRLGSWLLGSDQERALQQAATAAIQATVWQLRAGSATTDDPEGADHLARVIDQVFGQAPTPAESLTEHPTLLQGLQAGIAARLAVLEDAQITETGQSSAALLGVSVPTVADALIDHMLRELVTRGASGGPLTPLAAQLNHDITHLQGQQHSASLARLTKDLHSALAVLSRLDKEARSIPARATLPLGRLVHELTDPFAFEVHRAIEAQGGTRPLGALPAYVERDHDRQLHVIVTQAAGGRSAAAVLVGGSSTGKTRACWEAVHALPHDWRLWHPIDPSRPEAALDALPAVGPRTVIWLNEAQHYLLTPASPLGERLAAGLRALLRDPGRGPVLVLGTIWPEYWAILTTSPSPDPPEQDPYAQARALLVGTDIPVPGAFTGPDLAAVQTAGVRDPRLAQALAEAEDGQITQFLAGAPALLERYRNAPPAAKALIGAAMDARRLGHGPALPYALLKDAAPSYLNDQQWDALGSDWLEQALAYTAAPCRGARGPLTRIRPRPGQPAPDQPRYRLADYLVQTGRTTRRADAASAALWNALLAHADSDNLIRVGGEAQHRGLYRYAFHLYAAAADAGNERALEGVARLLGELERHTEAINWLEARAEAGQTRALYWAGFLSEPEYLDSTVVEVVIRGSAEEALTFYQRAAEAGDADAGEDVARVLRDLGRTEEALAWLLPRVDTDDFTALEDVARLLEDVGRDDEAQAFQLRADAILESWRSERTVETTRALARLPRLRPRAEAGDLEAMREVADLLWKADSNSTEAITFYQRAAEGGDTDAWGNAAALLDNAGRRAEAITWLQAGSAAGHAGALYPAAQMLERDERTEEAVDFYQRAAETGRTHALDEAARLLRESAHALREAGQIKRALGFFRRAAEAGDTNALMWAAELLKESGRTEEAIEWLQTLIDADKIDAAVYMGWLMNEAGRREEAFHVLTWLQDRAATGDTHALRSAAALLDKLDRKEEALTHYLRAAETGDTSAFREAGLLLSWYLGRDEEAEQLRRYGLEPGGRISTGWSLAGPDNSLQERPLS